MTPPESSSAAKSQKSAGAANAKTAPAPAARREEFRRRLLDLRNGYQRPSADAPAAPKKPKTRSSHSRRASTPLAPVTPIEPVVKPKAPKKYPYSKKEVEEFRRLLEDERDQLTSDISILDEISNTQDEGGGYDHHIFSIHIAEHATDNSMLETNLMQRRMLQDRLNQILDSLRRLEEGTFGLCEKCGGPIGLKRLQAKPHAVYCIECRKIVEARQRSLA